MWLIAYLMHTGLAVLKYVFRISLFKREEHIQDAFSPVSLQYPLMLLVFECMLSSDHVATPRWKFRITTGIQ
jgi:hypothetical protein